MSEPSFDGWETRKRTPEKPPRDMRWLLEAVFVGILVAILAKAIIALPLPVKAAEGSYHEWSDAEMCEHLDRYVNGDDPKIISYCKDHG